MARLRVGQHVKVSASHGYYSGDGIVKSIQKLRQQSTPSSKVTVREMVAVYFTGKGTVWFNKSEVRVAK
jgi:hypothetical protein